MYSNNFISFTLQIKQIKIQNTFKHLQIKINSIYLVKEFSGSQPFLIHVILATRIKHCVTLT